MFTIPSVTVLCLIIFPAVLADIDCGADGFNEESVRYPHLNKDYYFRQDIETVDDASKYCKERGMTLLSILSKEENNWLQKQIICRNLSKFSFWTVGSRVADGATWEWTPKGEGIDFKNWAPGRPTPPGSGKDCIQIQVTGQTVEWTDENCKKQQYFICEKLLPDTSDII